MSKSASSNSKNKKPPAPSGAPLEKDVACNGSESRMSVKVQLNLPRGRRIGPGKIRILELIASEGSLARAAEAMGISYRRAWQFVQQLNDMFDQPCVATPEHRHGGAAAKLTDFGSELVTRFRALEDAANTQGQDTLAWIDRHGRSDT